MPAADKVLSQWSHSLGVKPNRSTSRRSTEVTWCLELPLVYTKLNIENLIQGPWGFVFFLDHGEKHRTCC